MTGTIGTTIVLVVSPSLNVDGRKAYSTRGQLFDGKVDGRSVVERSTTPFCDAARVLLAEGVRPEAKIVMRHAGSAADALRSTVGAAAGLTVTDATADGKPRFAKWQPNRFRGEGDVCSDPPMRETDPAAVLVPSGSENLPPSLPMTSEPAAYATLVANELRGPVS
jgi:hypothetical protein